MPPRAAYVHVPFCHRHCGYCNFTVLAGRDDLVDRYLKAIERELRQLKTPREVDTLFVGGGTPSYLSPGDLRRMLNLLLRWFPLAEGYEWSVEANPEDLDQERLRTLAEAGVNRISLGVQSFQNGKLANLERCHDREQALRGIENCRQRFDSLAIDLIFAAPGESLDDWRQDLMIATSCGCDHISTYGLTYEKGAAFWSKRRRGQLCPQDEEVERGMYEQAISQLAAAGYEHYEVSNFARPSHRCRHNMTYWTGSEYYAVGPGASRYVDGWRETNHRSTTTYLRRLEAGESPVVERQRLNPADRTRERLVFQLRLLDGVDVAKFELDTGFALTDLVGDLADDFIRLGLLEFDAGNLRLSRDGLLVSDSLWGYLLSGQSSK